MDIMDSSIVHNVHSEAVKKLNAVHLRGALFGSANTRARKIFSITQCLFSHEVVKASSHMRQRVGLMEK